MDLYGPAPIQDEVETLPSQELKYGNGKYYAILIYVHIDILPVHTLYLYLSTSIYICICACIDIDIDMYLCTYVYLSLYLYSNLCLLYLYIYIYMYRAGQIRQIISYAPGENLLTVHKECTATQTAACHRFGIQRDAALAACPLRVRHRRARQCTPGSGQRQMDPLGRTF